MSNPKGRKNDIVIQEMDGEVLIYDLEKNKAFCLNETSSLVWQLCDGDHSVSDISEKVSKRLNSPVNEDLIWLALDQLKKEKLIVNGDEFNSKFEGMSRRDVIKKVGLGTMIALPIVSSLIAPTAAHAASATCMSIGTSCTCTADVGMNNACTATAGTTCPTNCRCIQSNNGNLAGTCQT